MPPALFTSVIVTLRIIGRILRLFGSILIEDNKIMQHLIDKNGFTKVGELHGVYRPEENSYVYALLTGN